MNLADRFAFLSGLPRTGSTVLTTLLSQHPQLHPTGSSCVREIILSAHNFRLGESPYFDHDDPNSQMWGIMRGGLLGAYSDVDEGKIIVEKDRGWASNLPRLRRLLGSDPKIIATVRPVTEIISSFILLSDKLGGKGKIDEIALERGKPGDNRMRARIIWDQYIYPNWRTLKAGWECDPDCFLLLSYDDIVSRPQETMGRICTYLHIEPFGIETQGLSNPNPENDAVYGLPGLHDVRTKLERASPSATEVLGEELYERWMSRDLDFWTK